MTRATRTGSLVWLTIGCGLTAAQIASAQTFTGLGFLPGTTGSAAWGVSGDGFVAVGNSLTPSFRWTSAGGMQNLGIPTGYQSATTFATNDDGSVIVGFLTVPPSPFQFPRAYRWTSSSGMVALGTFPDGLASASNAVNGDGSVVVGFGATASGDRAFRWTAASGLVNLGTLTGGTMSGAFGVSRDGLVVVGFSGSPGGNRAFRWTNAGGMENLGTLPGETQSWANDISADGSTIVGYSGSRAFRWNAAEGMVSLGAAAANAAASNKNGLVIVGGSGSNGFLWTPGLGMVSLSAFLPTLGINLTGWTGMSPKSISSDGLTIVGSGTHNGVAEGWILTLGPRCLANCDNSFIPPALNVNDFLCFNNHFALGDPMANCDGSTVPPVLNVSDFVCFLNKYAAGCP